MLGYLFTIHVYYNRNFDETANFLDIKE